jgi:small-conductance mechanosensitive channel/CRP-like cAMP-binding protein
MVASAVAFLAFAAAGLLLRYAPLSVALQQQIRGIQPLLIAFGIINLTVALAINPWRVDRLPDRFPKIVQDTIVIVLFAVAATLILQEKIFTTTAVGAVVVGFALQDTLGNLISGVAIQIEKPFRIGNWVTIGGKEGVVTEITWRATKITTQAGNFVIVPNSVLARDTITNYSEPIHETRLEVDIGVGYDQPPNGVKSTILDAIRDEPLLSRSHEPAVLIFDFASSAITYRILFWIRDFAARERARDQVLSRVFHAFRRRRITIPYPIQTYMRHRVAAEAADPGAVDAAIRSVEIFAALSDEERAQLVRAAKIQMYAAGEVIVRQGDPGQSMFVVAGGEVVVGLDAPRREVARLGRGGFFGEMSLLAGDPRTATVTAVTDCELVEIAIDSFRRFVLANPAAVDQISAAAAARAAVLDQHRAAAAAEPGLSEPVTSFLARVRRFLALS